MVLFFSLSQHKCIIDNSELFPNVYNLRRFPGHHPVGRELTPLSDTLMSTCAPWQTDIHTGAKTPQIHTIV